LNLKAVSYLTPRKRNTRTINGNSFSGFENFNQSFIISLNTSFGGLFICIHLASKEINSFLDFGVNA